MREKLAALFQNSERVLLVLSILYFLGFVYLWAGGGYAPMSSGRFRITLNGHYMAPPPDCLEWQPRYGFFQADYLFYGGKTGTRSDVLGKFYYPCLWVTSWFKERVVLVDEMGENVATYEDVVDLPYHPMVKKEAGAFVAEYRDSEVE